MWPNDETLCSVVVIRLSWHSQPARLGQYTPHLQAIHMAQLDMIALRQIRAGTGPTDNIALD